MAADGGTGNETSGAAQNCRIQEQQRVLISHSPMLLAFYLLWWLWVLQRGCRAIVDRILHSFSLFSFFYIYFEI